MNIEMRTKIFIIEDDKETFETMKQIIEQGQLFKVIPESFKELENAFDKNHDSITIWDYVKKVIKANFNKGLKLIICDLDFNGSTEGDRLIKCIRNDRNYQIEECKYFTSIIPIIVYTNYPESEKEAINQGANLSIIKAVKSANKVAKNNVKEKLLATIKSQIELFDKTMQVISENFLSDAIKDEVIKFKKQHKDEITAFIMTSFQEEHKKIAEKIKDILKDVGIIGCIANKEGGEFADQLFTNVEILIHGCDFGIGIYADDSIINKEEKIRINSNLSLEVGYMLALRKKICILKEKKLQKINSDLCDRIYVSFDKEQPSSLKKSLNKWLDTKGLLKGSNDLS
ncbi:TIR domain-containing protein [uncultured Bacteroides sp.]|uniref:TIR domain-containing protein n=1 Tax=uncultured Bacteroides sp. TaxID=162156 RepID=UPI002AAC33F3|nr:TIR domain-containing protein [uncultured Bacteroides sp.]